MGLFLLFFEFGPCTAAGVCCGLCLALSRHGWLSAVLPAPLLLGIVVQGAVIARALRVVMGRLAPMCSIRNVLW